MFVFRKRKHQFCVHKALHITSTFIIALALTACGIPAENPVEALPESMPLQSSVATPGVAIPTNTPVTPVAVQVATLAASATAPNLPPVPTPIAPLTPTAILAAPAIKTPPPTLSPTVNAARGLTVTPTVNNPSGLGTFLTSTSVVGTITALAATPTYPPTGTPRPRRQSAVRPASVIGAAGDAVPPTTAPDKTGVTVQSKSQRVFPKGPATLTIKTKPNVACELSNIRKNEQGKEVLEPISSGSAKTSGSDGVIAWIWSVDGDEPTGSMTLVIDCRTAGVKQVTMVVQVPGTGDMNR